MGVRDQQADDVQAAADGGVRGDEGSDRSVVLSLSLLQRGDPFFRTGKKMHLFLMAHVRAAERVKP